MRLRRLPGATDQRLVALIASPIWLLCASCIDFSVPSDGIFPAPSFIVGGTMQADAETKTCSIFSADNGVKYHLFQGPRLTNEEFDQLFEDGSRSRLEIQVRGDLDLTPCRRGLLVEVVDILEFVPAN